MKTPLHLIEDHSDSYIHWKKAGLTGLTVVHPDAHLDLRDDGFFPETLKKITECKTVEELEKYHRNEDILWDGFHPGNYLYPAAKDGTVKKLIWVIPPHLPGGQNLDDWAREEIARWKNLEIDEWKSFEVKDGIFRGVLAGIDFEICFLEDLKVEEEKIVWDVDVDFCFNDDDTSWISPSKLAEGLRKGASSPIMITVAYSVNGGYTAPWQKYMGDLIVNEIEGKGTEEQREAWKDFREFDRLVIMKKYEEAKEILQKVPDTPLFSPAKNLRLADLAKLEGRDADAVKLLEQVKKENSKLIIPDYDRAMIHFRRKEYNDALEILKKTAQKDETNYLLSHFLSAVVFLEMKKFDKASDHWEELTKSGVYEKMGKGVKSNILYLKGFTFNALKNYEEAIKYLSEAIMVFPDYTDAYLQRGTAYLESKNLDRAARDFRKFITLAPTRLDSLEAHTHLAEIYKTQGKGLLESIERKNISKKDVTGLYSIKSLLSSSRNMF